MVMKNSYVLYCIIFVLFKIFQVTLRRTVQNGKQGIKR